jgi:hypothetical protein
MKQDKICIDSIKLEVSGLPKIEVTGLATNPLFGILLIITLVLVCIACLKYIIT